VRKVRFKGDIIRASRGNLKKVSVSIHWLSGANERIELPAPAMHFPARMPDGNKLMPHGNKLMPHGNKLMPHGSTTMLHSFEPVPHEPSPMPPDTTVVPHGTKMTPQVPTNA